MPLLRPLVSCGMGQSMPARDPAADEVEALVKRLFPQANNNRYALNEWVGRFCKMTTELTPVQYARVYYMIHNLEPMNDIEDRLAKYAVRLEDVGEYVNAEIVSRALGKMADGL